MLTNAPIRAYIPASNLQRARKFYEETLGLKPGEQYGGESRSFFSIPQSERPVILSAAGAKDRLRAADRQ